MKLPNSLIGVSSPVCFLVSKIPPKRKILRIHPRAYSRSFLRRGITPTFLMLLFTILVGGFLRFNKLDWGEGYSFHPDEYHIIGAVGNLINGGLFSNPKLFSYGSFTVYLIYVSRLILVEIFNITNPNPFIIGRFLSATFSTLTLLNIYFISKKVFPKREFYPLLTVFISSFIPGLIQQAHFLTPETFMTFWITLSFCFLISYNDIQEDRRRMPMDELNVDMSFSRNKGNPARSGVGGRHYERSKILNIILAAMTLGIACGTKISALAAVPFTMVFMVLVNLRKEGIIKNLQKIIIYSITAFIFFFAVFPYSIIDHQNFLGTSSYESSVSLGKIKVFYTRSFENSIPVVFQIVKIYPYTLGMSLLIFSLAGLLVALLSFIKKDNKQGKYLALLLGYFLSYFIFNSFLFTKWTRYVHITLPFLIIFAVFFIYEISQYFKNPLSKKIAAVLLSLLLLIPTLIWSVMFLSIYKNHDVRITATDWIFKNISNKSLILTETGNTLEVPLWGNYHLIPFDFYNLDRDPNLHFKLINYLESSDYFIIQSRRIYANHANDKYPITNNFYNALLSGKLGFEEVKTFNSFPKIRLGNWKLEIRDEAAEETWSVFDHPTIQVYKKVQAYPPSFYDILLGLSPRFPLKEDDISNSIPPWAESPWFP